MREIKFRAWDNRKKEFVDGADFVVDNIGIVYNWNSNNNLSPYPSHIKLMQYTGLKDKNNVKIYEHMELDNTYEVEFNTAYSAYILTNISNGDIINLSKYLKDKDGQVEITKEYTKI